MTPFGFFTTALKPLEKLCAAVCMPFTGNFAAPYKAKYPDKIKLNAAVLSDLHIDGRKERIRKLHHGLSDIERSLTPNNALVCVGDTSDTGSRDDWETARGIFADHKPAEHTLIVCGNHDRPGFNEEYEPYLKLFLEYSRKISGRELTVPYFYEVINGYTFIALTQEEDDLLTPEQLSWFEQRMELAAQSGLPVFVFMHESLNISHGLPYIWEKHWSGERLPDPHRSGIGVNSDDIEKILKKHKNVFLFSGHIHLGLTGRRQMRSFGFSNFETDGSLHRINVPCFMFPNHHGLPSSGLGYQLEVYDDRVLIRPRSYASSVWYSRYDKEFILE